MLRVIPYTKTLDIFNFSYIEDDLPLTVICPNPKTADEVRTRVEELSGKRINVLTIAKFISNNISDIGEGLEIYRKADLMLELSLIWKKYFPEFEVETFLQAFTIFTELRSYTTEIELIEEVLGEFPEAVSNGIKIFWLYLNEAGIYDEQSAYFLIANQFKDLIDGNNERESLVFYGFSHLSAGQIDLVNALSIGNNIYIPFPKDVLPHSRGSDWINWFNVGKLDDEVEQSDQKIKQIEGNLLSKNRLSEALDTTQAAGRDILLGMKNPELVHISEVPVEGYYFKVQVNLFEGSFKRATDELEELFFKDRQSSISTDELLLKVDEWFISEQSVSLEKMDFKKIKILTTLKESIEKWRELSELAVETTFFDFKVIKEIAQLSLPRNFQSPILNEMQNGSIFGLESLESISVDHNLVLIVTSQYSDISLAEEQFSEEMYKFLGAVGPIKRKALEFELLKSRMIEIIRDNNVELYYEEAILESSQFWEEVLHKFEVEVKNTSLESKYVNAENLIKDPDKIKAKELKSLSATRLQTYLDCPQKYYYNYIDRLYQEPQIEEGISAADKGTIQHDAIDKYLTKENQWDTDIHTSLVNQLVSEYLKEKKIVLSAIDMQASLIEIRDYSARAIHFILSIKKALPNANTFFEHEFVNGINNGSIDCLLKIGDEFAIIDFKRSGFGIPSKIEFLEQRKIQLWFYLQNCGIDVEKCKFVGYVNLSDIEDSLFFVNQDLAGSEVIHGLLSDSCKCYDLSLSSEEAMPRFESYKDEILNKIKNETTFLAEPINDSTCTYCSINLICRKGGVA